MNVHFFFSIGHGFQDGAGELSVRRDAGGESGGSRSLGLLEMRGQDPSPSRCPRHLERRARPVTATFDSTARADAG